MTVAGPADVVVVDGNNVMGSVPDGWWRDPRGAARRVARRVVAYRSRVDHEVVLVLDVPHPELPAGRNDGVEVCYPEQPGRDGADRRILELLQEREQDLTGRKVEVVTSDRALARSVRALGVDVVGAGTFLARLKQLGC